MSGSHIITYLSLLDSFFDACEEFTGPVGDHTEELAASELILTNGNSIVPNAYNYHDVANVHLLKDSEELFAGPILTIVIKSLC